MSSPLKTVEDSSVNHLVGLPSPTTSKTGPHLKLVIPQGQLQVHTASVRGSFSMVFSDALRAAGFGSKVLIAQFLKGGVSQGPKNGIKLCNNLQWIRPDIPNCIDISNRDSSEIDQSEFENEIKNIWEICKEKLIRKEIDRLVLDEISLAVRLGFIDENDLISTLNKRPPAIDVILTGPYISNEINEMADQVTSLR